MAPTTGAKASRANRHGHVAACIHCKSWNHEAMHQHCHLSAVIVLHHPHQSSRQLLMSSSLAAL
ncbi:hypothetical protein TIFTF001_052823 [Ficus carica]|uniref:Uncharacterized protein n=1 Tax=Ficus carica TaxID=3494 RepID=A0AA88EE46_FICCA|nr:hypothetical protein TIFTF001_052823 [Ficus carica]